MFNTLGYHLFPTSLDAPAHHRQHSVGLSSPGFAKCEVHSIVDGVADVGRRNDDMANATRPRSCLTPEEEVRVFRDIARVVEYQRRAGIRPTRVYNGLPELLPSCSSAASTPASSCWGTPATQPLPLPSPSADVVVVRHYHHTPAPPSSIRTRVRTTSLREMITATEHNELGCVAGTKMSSSREPRTTARKTATCLSRPQSSLLLRCIANSFSSRNSSRNPSRNSSRNSSCGPSSPSYSAITFPSSATDLPTKCLAPLPRFNPFLRMRSESLSSIVQSTKNADGEGALLERSSLSLRRRCKSASSCMTRADLRGRRQL